MNVNKNFLKLEESYLFSEISRRVSAFSAAHPEAKILRMGIGDVTLPLAPAVVEAMREASAGQDRKESFCGYGPEQGYPFLREAIAAYYARTGVCVDPDDIFVSDGAKSDLGNILDIFGRVTSLIPDPVYPVYVDTNVMAGNRIVYAQATRENGFLPMPDEGVDADLIYLCSPNNPTGAAYTRAQLAEWVEYAKRHDAVILFDAAYESFVTDPACARSIYEIEGAKEVVTICPFCSVCCQVIAYVRDGKLVSTEGDPDHPITQGHLCLKAFANVQKINSPDRVKYPMLRVGERGEGKFKRISWDEAMDWMVDKIHTIQEQYGSEAIMEYCYSGNREHMAKSVSGRLWNLMGASKLVGSFCLLSGVAGSEGTVDPRTGSG